MLPLDSLLDPGCCISILTNCGISGQQRSESPHGKMVHTHEDDGCPVALLQAEIIVHAGDACDCHIGTVDESQGVEAAKDGEEAKVDLPQQTPLELWVLRGSDRADTTLGVKVFGQVLLGGAHAFAVIDVVLVVHVGLAGVGVGRVAV